MDFTQAIRKKEQLDAAADAAAIAAVRPAMLMQSDTVASDTAMAIFMSVANSMQGLTSAPTPTISVTTIRGFRAPSRFIITPHRSIISPKCS